MPTSRSLCYVTAKILVIPANYCHYLYLLNGFVLKYIGPASNMILPSGNPTNGYVEINGHLYSNVQHLTVHKRP